MNSLISVVIPMYNTSAYIWNCVESIVRNGYDNVEVIIVDDGSTDDSLKQAKKIKETYSCVRVLTQKNAGVSAARNIGIDHARGEFIMFVDSDDLLNVGAIQYMCSHMKRGIDMVSSELIKTREIVQYATLAHRSNKVYSNFYLSSTEALKDLLYQQNIVNMPGAKLYRRELLRDVRYPVGVSVGEDMDFMIRVLRAVDTVVVTSFPSYFYYQRAGSVMRSKFQEKHIDAYKVLKRAVETDTSGGISSALKYRLFMETTYVLVAMPFLSKYFITYGFSLMWDMMRYGYVTVFNSNARMKYRLYGVVGALLPPVLVISFKFKRTVGRIKK